jgi:hypothetical protein
VRLFSRSSRKHTEIIEIEDRAYIALRARAERLGLDFNQVLEEAVSNHEGESPENGDLRPKNESIKKEAGKLIGEHITLSSKLAALRRKYFSTYYGCATEPMRLLALEAEHRSLCEATGQKYDSTHYQREKGLFEKYHQDLRVRVEKGG